MRMTMPVKVTLGSWPTPLESAPGLALAGSEDLAGLVVAVREGTFRPGERRVFLHSGGMPGLFGHPDALRRIAD